jgi:hypothetical protein
MHVSMPIPRRTVLIALLAAAGACSDRLSAPPTARPAFDIQALQPLESKTDKGSKPVKIDSSKKTLTIDPNVSRTYAFGEDWVYFPAHSICDPATSGYGPSYWDQPCTPLDKPIQITVHWSSKGGYAFAHFSPELRFVPADADDVSRWVVLSLRSHRKLQDVDAYSILYSAAQNLWVDEALADPTLHAWLDAKHNSVVRRVKHFSGYMVAAAYSGYLVGAGLGGSDASY